MLNRQGRPTEAGAAEVTAGDTFTGNRGLQIEEALIFEEQLSLHLPMSESCSGEKDKLTFMRFSGILRKSKRKRDTTWLQ